MWTGRQAMTRRLLVPMLIVVMLLGGGSWSVRHAPFYLPTIENRLPVESDEELRVFGYATLTIPLVRLVVAGRPLPSSPATLSGYSRDGRALHRDVDGQVEGRVFDVTLNDLHRIDRYERLGTRYDRVEMVLDDGKPAMVYMLLY
jgi:hypothetical protein